MQNVITVFRFVMRYADMLVADLSDAEMVQIPHPGMNHPAWVLGHITMAIDSTARILDQPGLTDREWIKKFGPGSTPVEDIAVYPTKAELLAKLKAVGEHAIKCIENATPEQLAGPNKTRFFPEVFPTVADFATHLLTTHPSLHLGQLSAWRRVLGKGSVLGV
ncbi:MAG: DinB family protein [Planctomycetales bacterium]